MACIEVVYEVDLATDRPRPTRITDRCLHCGAEEIRVRDSADSWPWKLITPKLSIVKLAPEISPAAKALRNLLALVTDG